MRDAIGDTAYDGNADEAPEDDRNDGDYRKGPASDGGVAKVVP